MRPEQICAEAIAKAQLQLAQTGVDTPRLDAELILAYVLGSTRLEIITHGERILSPESFYRFEELIAERVQRKPLAYITGRREFYGLDLAVTSQVLVPRPETESLVEQVLSKLPEQAEQVADVGTGSGCISVALALERPTLHIIATDVSSAALSTARENAAKHCVLDRIELRLTNLLDCYMGKQSMFDAVVSNPPYIPSDEIDSLQPEISIYEPRVALDGGSDGLHLVRDLMRKALPLLKPKGFVALEIGAGQAAEVCETADGLGYVRTETAKDLAGIDRVVLAYR